MSTPHHLLSQTLLPGLAHTGTVLQCLLQFTAKACRVSGAVCGDALDWHSGGQPQRGAAGDAGRAAGGHRTRARRRRAPLATVRPLPSTGLPVWTARSTGIHRIVPDRAKWRVTVTSRSIVCSAAAVREEGKRSDRCSACTQVRQRRTAARQPSGSDRLREKARPSGPPSRHRSAAAAAPRRAQPRSRSGERRQRATRQTRRMTSMTVQSPLSSLCRSLWIARGPACY